MRKFSIMQEASGKWALSMMRARMVNMTLALAAIYMLAAFVLPARASAEEQMSGDFSAFGLPFKQFGTISYKIADQKFPCKLGLSAPPVVFDRVLKSVTPTGGLPSQVRSNLIREICAAQYMPLGKNAFLVHFRGLGVVDLTSDSYSTIFGSFWHGDDYISAQHKLGIETSVMLYRGDVSPDGGLDARTYYALFIRRTNLGSVVIQYATLIGGELPDANGALLCPEEVEGVSRGSGRVSGVFSPSVRIAEPIGAVIFAFTLKTKHCDTGTVNELRKRFTYSRGTLRDQEGKQTAILTLGH